MACEGADHDMLEPMKASKGTDCDKHKLDVEIAMISSLTDRPVAHFILCLGDCLHCFELLVVHHAVTRWRTHHICGGRMSESNVCTRAKEQMVI